MDYAAVSGCTPMSHVDKRIKLSCIRLVVRTISGFGYSLPSRATVYVEELNRIVLKAKSTFTSFSNTGATRKVTILTRVLQLVHGVLTKGIHVTKVLPSSNNAKRCLLVMSWTISTAKP